jgi:uncharacterized protein YprB with RNaseH-like and TPR domain
MSLRKHLQRLELERSAPRARAPEPRPSSTLDELRARMAEILSRPPTASAAAVLSQRLPLEQACAELGFECVENEQGVFFRRQLLLGGSERVGNFPVTGIAGVDCRILSLLALDPSLAGCRPGAALFLDTETTGLGGGSGTVAFLVGLMFSDESGCWFEQLLLGGPEQETALLCALGKRLSACEMVVSFNGKSFDWPLLLGRYVMSGLPRPENRPHLDLLHVARRIHAQRSMRCNLKMLESEVLGFVRGEDLDGAEVAQYYGHFLRSGDASGLAAVVEHNRWDVLSMGALMALYGEAAPGLLAPDLVGFARTLLRSKALEEAQRAVQQALSAGAGAHALRVRADVYRALGDHAAAVGDLEAVAAEVDDAKLRLELAKLYEHRMRSPERALGMLELGVAERPEQAERRRLRLRRKLER